ncbi:Hypothetical predicted protein, partial [Paramuricea clavata]
MYDVRVQNKRRVVRAVGNTNLTAERNIGATSDFLITKVIRAKNDGGARNDEKAKESSGTRMSAEQRNEDVAAHSNSNTTHVDIRNGDVQNSDARKSQEGGGKTLTDTSRNNDGSNEAIRKILEGKPFIFPVCDKGHSSRNGLKHHYKKHQNGNEEKFWLHDVKVHGLIETSLEESDSEMVAGHEERVGSTWINMTDTRTDVRSGGDIRGDRMDWRLGRVSQFKPGNDRK